MCILFVSIDVYMGVEHYHRRFIAYKQKERSVLEETC